MVDEDSTRQGAVIAANTIALLVVTVAVTVALAGMILWVGHKCRGEQRLFGTAGILDEAVEDARLVERHDALVDELALHERPENRIA